jgi:hypothetical protein
MKGTQLSINDVLESPFVKIAIALGMSIYYNGLDEKYQKQLQRLEFNLQDQQELIDSYVEEVGEDMDEEQQEKLAEMNLVFEKYKKDMEGIKYVLEHSHYDKDVKFIKRDIAAIYSV